MAAYEACKAKYADVDEQNYIDKNIICPLLAE